MKTKSMESKKVRYKCLDCDYIGDNEALQDHVLATKCKHTMMIDSNLTKPESKKVEKRSCLICGLRKHDKNCVAKPNKPKSGKINKDVTTSGKIESMESRFDKKFVYEDEVLGYAPTYQGHEEIKQLLRKNIAPENIKAFIRNERKLTRLANDKKWRARIEGKRWKKVTKLNEYHKKHIKGNEKTALKLVNLKRKGWNDCLDNLLQGEV